MINLWCPPSTSGRESEGAALNHTAAPLLNHAAINDVLFFIIVSWFYAEFKGSETKFVSGPLDSLQKRKLQLQNTDVIRATALFDTFDDLNHGHYKKQPISRYLVTWHTGFPKFFGFINISIW